MKRFVVFLIICVILVFYRQDNIESNIAKLNKEEAIMEINDKRLARNIINYMCSPLNSKDLKMILLGDISDVWMDGGETTLAKCNEEDVEFLYRYKKKNSGNLVTVSVKNERIFVVDMEDFAVVGGYIGK